VCFFPDPGHDQDVVIFAEREQEAEQQDEGEPAAAKLGVQRGVLGG
jgi:hypothetical protein